MSWPRVFFFCLLSIAVPGHLTFAQTGSNAGLTGAVTDTAGAAISSAHIVATNLATHVTYNATATLTGVYNIPSIPPGMYDISATHEGFSKSTVTSVTFHVGELLNVDLKLSVGPTSQSVTVSSDVQLMETGSSQINYLAGEHEIENWPLLAVDGSRDAQAFLYTNLPGTTGHTAYGSINGGQEGKNEIYFEGLPIGTFDTMNQGFGMDATREVNVQTGVMNAQYNGGGTAVTNIGLKSGTNEFHGSLLDLLQNEDLNANSYAAKQAGKPRAENRFNLYSIAVGGPVSIPKLYNGKDRTFFFFNFERSKINNLGYGGTNVTMPTPAMMRGDFSAWLNPALTQNPQSATVASKDILGRPVYFGQIYNPSTTRILKAGQVDPVTGLTATSAGFVRDPYLNNQIPTNQFDPVAANILKLDWPTNYLSNQVVSNVSTLASNQPTLSQQVITAKGDQVLTAKQKLSFAYDYQSKNLLSNLAPAWSQPSEHNILDTSYTEFWRTQIFRLNHYWTLSSAISNHIGAGYTSLPERFNDVQPNQNWASELGITNFDGIGFPTMTFGGPVALAGSSNELGSPGAYDGQLRDGSNFMFVDQVYISHGAHQIQVGFEGRYYIFDWTNSNTPGTYSFSNAMTDDGTSTADYAGNAFASFLLGQLNSLSSTVYSGPQRWRRHTEALYVQDDWRLTPHLTFNLGLRWEITGRLSEAKGEWSGVDLSVPNTAAGNLPGALVFASQLGKKSFENTNWNLILPRVGFAYNPNPKVVFRAGLGINSQAPEYYYTPFFGNYPSFTGYSASIALTSTTNPQPYSGMAVGGLSSPYPAPTVPLPNFNPTQLNGQSVFVVNRGDTHAIPPYYANYTAGVQIDLSHATIGQINYVGNTGKRLPASSGLGQLNQLPISDLAQYGDALGDNISLHPNISKPYPTFAGTVAQALAPYPQFAGGGVTLFDSDLGWSRYDALQATLTRQMKSGLSLLASYTWSKTLTDTNGGSQNVYNPRAEKAVGTFIHVPQIFKITAVYDLPFGKGKLVNLHGPSDWIAGGWRITGNGIYESGDTLAITDSFVANGIFATTRPNFTGQPIKLNQKGFIDTAHSTGPFYLNPAAFAHVPYTPNYHIALTTGNVPSVLPGIQGPGYAYENLGLQKEFGFGEGRSFSFRADAFNALNRAGRGDPVTDINNANFGRIVSTKAEADGTIYSAGRLLFNPRTIQVQGKFTF
jgi:Carboxypeptidase regulatory-like domain